MLYFFYVFNLPLRWTSVTILCFLIYGQTSSHLCVVFKFAFEMECVICFYFIINNFVEHMFVFHLGSMGAAFWLAHLCWTRRDTIWGLDAVGRVSETNFFSQCGLIHQDVAQYPKISQLSLDLSFLVFHHC